MQAAKVRYIMQYYSELMTENEQRAKRHLMALEWLGPTPSLERKKMLEARGHISHNPEVLKLVQDGVEAFEQRTALRMLEEEGAKVFLNYCPNCAGLARTPKAKQCPHCFHSWR